MNKKIIDRYPTSKPFSDEIKAALLINREQQLRSSGRLWEILSGIAEQMRELVSAVWTLIDEIRALRRQLTDHSPVDTTASAHGEDIR
jgi:hypothetical protein